MKLKKLSTLIFLATVLIHASATASHRVDKVDIDRHQAECQAESPTQDAPTKIIFTGGPSVGKTTILLALEQFHDEVFIPEAATSVIAVKVANGEKPETFTFDETNEAIIKLQKKRMSKIVPNSKGRVFLDRCPVDVLAYEMNPGSDTYEFNLTEALKMKNDPTVSDTIFLVESLGKFTSTQIRKEGDVEEAKELEASIIHNYEALGFNIVRIPAGTVQERVDFVLEQLSMLDHEA